MSLWNVSRGALLKSVFIMGGESVSLSHSIYPDGCNTFVGSWIAGIIFTSPLQEIMSNECAVVRLSLGSISFSFLCGQKAPTHLSIIRFLKDLNSALKPCWSLTCCIQFVLYKWTWHNRSIQIFFFEVLPNAHIHDLGLIWIKWMNDWMNKKKV